MQFRDVTERVQKTGANHEKRPVRCPAEISYAERAFQRIQPHFSDSLPGAHHAGPNGSFAGPLYPGKRILGPSFKKLRTVTVTLCSALAARSTRNAQLRAQR